jgi:hypothetical protein
LLCFVSLALTGHVYEAAAVAASYAEGVTGMLQHSGDGPVATCVGCGVQAVGPCARCHAPLCGDCCIISEGGAKKWAVCASCADKGASSLSSGWTNLVLWIMAPIAALALLIWLLETIAG